MRYIGPYDLNCIDNGRYYRFCVDLFEGTNTSYGIMLSDHNNVSSFVRRATYLPLPFIKIVNTMPMQSSLNKIQTSHSYRANYRMFQTRYEHMLYAYLLGTDLLIMLEDKGFMIDNKTKIAFLVFLLTHDVGHGPFSHPFENMVDGYKGMHEDIGKRAIVENIELLNSLENIYPGLSNNVINFASYDKTGLHEICENQFDLDRASFMLIDTYLSERNQELADGKCLNEELLNSIYRILNGITLNNGHLYYDISTKDDILFFLKTRRDNYNTIYQDPYRILDDEILKRIGERILVLNLDKYQNSKIDEAILSKIRLFTSFIMKMKKEKKDIDLNMYYQFTDLDFEDIFRYLLLVNDHLLNHYCLMMIGTINEVKDHYRLSDQDGLINFNRKTSFYKSDDFESIKLVDNKGNIFDLKDVTNEDLSTVKDTIHFKIKEHDYLNSDDKDEIKNNLYQLLKKYFEINMDKKINISTCSDNSISSYILNIINGFIKSVLDDKKEEFLLFNKIDERTILIYLTMINDSNISLYSRLLLNPDNKHLTKYSFKTYDIKMIFIYRLKELLNNDLLFDKLIITGESSNIYINESLLIDNTYLNQEQIILLRELINELLDEYCINTIKLSV